MVRWSLWLRIDSSISLFVAAWPPSAVLRRSLVTFGGTPPVVKQLFLGMGETQNGYLKGERKAGLGLDINEEIAAKYPLGQVRGGGPYRTGRSLDGTVVKP
jgi:hypothetical protein